MEDEIIGYDALWDSMEKCQRGVIWKDSVASFSLNAPERIMKLEEELRTGKYEMRPPFLFTITSPKRREISSVCFRDRVYQRSLNDNSLYPTMTRSFIFDNWACQKGKGTDHARDRLSNFLHSFYRKHGLNGYIGQFDVKGYYPNMNHAYIEGMFERKLPTEVYKRVEEVLRHQYNGDIGYNPGSQMIQIAGISALNDLDHFIKEKLKIRYYLRYMDDFILVHEDKEYLEKCKREIAEFITRGCFKLHEDKSRIFPIRDGILFLGFIFRLTKTGKVIKTVNPKNVKAERKKLRRLVAKSKRGETPRESVDESFRSWKDHASKGNSYKLIQRMDEFYKGLWEENNAENCTQNGPP